MERRIGGEHQVVFNNKNGHNHDGVNSSPIVLLEKQVHLDNLDDEVRYLLGVGGGEFLDSGEPVEEENSLVSAIMPVPDLLIETPQIDPGGSYSGSVSWVGMSFVRFVRILMSRETECDITFYHKATFADEDREFRAENCGNKFLWEGAWAHYDEDEQNQIHYKIENKGLSEAVFVVELRSGTMAANLYSDFIKNLMIGDDVMTGPVRLIEGNGVSFSVTKDDDDLTNLVTVSSVPSASIAVRSWTLAPQKPASASSSATLTGGDILKNGSGLTEFGTGPQWIKLDMGGTVRLGQIDVTMNVGNRVFKDVKIEVSANNTAWDIVKTQGDVWSSSSPVSVVIPNGKYCRYIRVWCNGNDSDNKNQVSSIVPLVVSDIG